MKKIFLSILSVVVFLNLSAQNKKGYRLFNAQGKEIRYSKMMKSLVKADIILFGEYHNNPISHWLQIETTKDLFLKRKIKLAAEMFEADNQPALSNYVSGKITQKAFDTLARLWLNYKTDYAPLVNFAKDNKLEFIAANIPRRYASLVSKKGFEGLDTLTALEKTWIAPLPIEYNAELPGYKKMLEMMGGHGGVNLPKAQAIKDATMAHFILKNRQPNELIIHYNGAYHSDNYEGILWYLQRKEPNLKYVTITTVSQKDNSKLDKENLHKADFIICVDDDMTTTY
jgi:uncharacterized iron-regulated protein